MGGKGRVGEGSMGSGCGGVGKENEEEGVGASVGGVLQQAHAALIGVKKEKEQALDEVEFEVQEKAFQIRATNSLQTKVDKLAALALAAGTDPAAVKAVTDSPL